jgi:hypothetical protein
MAKNATAQPTATNNTLTYKRDHPNNRSSYGVPGVPGIVVIDKRLFANGQAPKTITVDCALALPVAKAPAGTPMATKATQATAGATA